MESQVIINTQRLTLKGITPSIIHELYNTKSKSEIIQFFGFNEGGYDNFRAMHEKGIETHQLSLIFFLLIDKQSNLPIGECGFHTWNKRHNRAEVFYNLWNDKDKQNGFMTEAMKVVLHYGFTELELHRIQALVADYNIPSIKLLIRYGFTKEGTMREDYVVNGRNENSDCYSLLKWEWKKGDGKSGIL